MADWLHWELSDRETAWSGLQDVATAVTRGVGSRFHLQPADVENLAADVFVLAVDGGCARLRGLDGDVCLRAWLWGVARNLALTRSRLRTTVPLPRGGAGNFDSGAGEPAAMEALPTVSSWPAAEVSRLLDILTPAQREVEVALLDGLSERAIARILGISRTAVRERMARGRRRIRMRVDEAAAGEGPGARLDAAGQSRESDSEGRLAHGAPDRRGGR